MSLVYNFAQLKSAAEHALGGSPDTRISKGLIVNRAINYLVNAHAWKWRTKLGTLAYVAGNGDVVLPTDFGELIELVGYQAKYTAVKPLNAHELLMLRVHGVTDSLFLGYTIGVATQTDATVAPRYVLRVAPVPSTSLADALYILYNATVPTFTTNDALSTDDTKVPAIPPGQMDTLYQLVRAFAISMEEEPSNTEWALAQQFLQRDILADARTDQADRGPMRGTIADEYQNEGYAYRPHNQIYMPGD